MRNPVVPWASAHDDGMVTVDDGNANTALVWHAGRLLALEETARPYELDPVTLQTRGIYDFGGHLEGRTFTALPKIDPVAGEMFAFSYNSSGRPDDKIRHFDIAATGERPARRSSPRRTPR